MPGRNTEMQQTSTPADRIKHAIGSLISYIVFITWTLITVVPLIWMLYSSFKSNEELIKDIYAFPKALFENKYDEYVVIPKTLNVVLPYDPDKDPRERIIIESTTIAPTLRLMVHFLVKEDLPPELQSLKLPLTSFPQKFSGIFTGRPSSLITVQPLNGASWQVSL